MRKNGSTLVKLLTVLMIMVIVLYIVVIISIALLRGNFWFSESGVLQELQLENPEIVKISKTNRNVFNLSKIWAKDANDVTSIYELDTCILFNYDLRLSE